MVAFGVIELLMGYRMDRSKRHRERLFQDVVLHYGHGISDENSAHVLMIGHPAFISISNRDHEKTENLEAQKIPLVLCL